MDLGTFASETYQPDEAFDVELRGPDGSALFNDDESPMTIGVVGADSDISVKARNATRNRRLQQGPRMKTTAEAMEADDTAYLAKCTTRWNITMNGARPEFSRDAVTAIYSNPKLAFIREQIDAAIAERSNFTKASPKS